MEAGTRGRPIPMQNATLTLPLASNPSTHPASTRVQNQAIRSHTCKRCLQPPAQARLERKPACRQLLCTRARLCAMPRVPYRPLHPTRLTKPCTKPKELI
eukprot:scaffold5941_cov125-Isochrysis_galbana.AAC.4